MTKILFFFITIFLSQLSLAGDLILNDKNKMIMTAIKTDEIGTSRVRVTAWMNAQHEAGTIHCTLSGKFVLGKGIPTQTFKKGLILLPEEFVPLHLGSFSRSFDPSQSIRAKVVCKKVSPKLSTTKKRRGRGGMAPPREEPKDCTPVCCMIGSVTQFCACQANVGRVHIDIDAPHPMDGVEMVEKIPDCSS